MLWEGAGTLNTKPYLNILIFFGGFSYAFAMQSILFMRKCAENPKRIQSKT